MNQTINLQSAPIPSAVKAADISDKTIHLAHCDWLIKEAKESKALLSYNSPSMLSMNKTRAVSAIETMQQSLNELQAFFESEVA